MEKPPAVKPFDDSVLSLLFDPACRRAIEEVNRKYLYWDKVKYKVPDGVDRYDFWSAVKLSRQGCPLEFAGGIFTLYVTDEMQRLLHEADVKLLSTDQIPQKRRSSFLLSSIAEEAIASSRMEGASTTREKAKKMIRTQARPRDTSEKMIVNNYLTIEYLRENRNAALSKDLILEVHRMITDGTLDDRKYEGRLRESNEVVVADSLSGEIVHYPPDCACLEEGLSAICDFANDNGSTRFIHPVVKAVIIHFMLSYLHPFIDGNGRTARALFYWYMLKEGYWLTEFLAISRIIYKTKNRYEKAFIHTELDDGDLGYFVQYHLEALDKAFQDLEEYLERKRKEEDAIMEFRNVEGINDRQAMILEMFRKDQHSVFTAKDLVSCLCVTDKTVRTDLEDLVRLGFLERIPKNKRLVGYGVSTSFDSKLREIRGEQGL